MLSHQVFEDDNIVDPRTIIYMVQVLADNL